MEAEMELNPNITHHRLNWKIARFEDKFPKTRAKFSKLDSKLESGIFTVNADAMVSKWCVTIEREFDSILTCLSLKSASNLNGTKHWKTVRASFTLSIGNDENNEIVVVKTIKDREIQSGGGRGAGLDGYISIPSLYERRRTLLQNGFLQIFVKMYIHEKPPTSMTLANVNKTVNTLELLSRDFDRIFNNKQNSDVEILCGDETFYAHKEVLAARSTVFLAMFKSDVEEKPTSKIVVTEIDASVFRAILRYIYTGRAEVNDMNTYIDLIYGAEKYDLPELKHYCFDLLCNGVTVATIGDLAVAAETCNADVKVKEFIKKFFLRNIDEVVTDPAVKSFLISNPTAFF